MGGLAGWEDFFVDCCLFCLRIFFLLLRGRLRFCPRCFPRPRGFFLT